MARNKTRYRKWKRKYYKKNKKKILKYNRVWSKKNRKRRNRTNKKWRLKNKIRLSKLRRKYYNRRTKKQRKRHNESMRRYLNSLSPKRKKERNKKQVKLQQIRVEKIRLIINRLKNKPCMDCGGWFNPWQMDFDHRQGTRKIADVTRLVNTGSLNNLVKIYKEIDKCDLVCANCHRERTHKLGLSKNKKYRKTLTK